MSGVGFGSADESNTPRTLVCELQTYGKTAIHRGWRAGLSRKEPPVWVFCPLKPHKWRGPIPPKDRELLVKCQGNSMKNVSACPHYRGVKYSSLTQTADVKDSFKPEKAQHMKKSPVLIIPETTIDKVAKKKREWQKEERSKK